MCAYKPSKRTLLTHTFHSWTKISFEYSKNGEGVSLVRSSTRSWKYGCFTPAGQTSMRRRQPSRGPPTRWCDERTTANRTKPGGSAAEATNNPQHYKHVLGELAIDLLPAFTLHVLFTISMSHPTGEMIHSNWFTNIYIRGQRTDLRKLNNFLFFPQDNIKCDHEVVNNKNRIYFFLPLKETNHDPNLHPK